jgi:hypothetical protein
LNRPYIYRLEENKSIIRRWFEAENKKDLALLDEFVDEAEKAGIKTVMITGDHKLTAEAIAREVGIFKEGDLVLTGTELDKLGDAEFELVRRVSKKLGIDIALTRRRIGELIAKGVLRLDSKRNGLRWQWTDTQKLKSDSAITERDPSLRSG